MDELGVISSDSIASSLFKLEELNFLQSGLSSRSLNLRPFLRGRVMMTNAVISTTHRGEGGEGGGGGRASPRGSSSTFVEKKLKFPQLGSQQ